jgi:hypothetical protein
VSFFFVGTNCLDTEEIFIGKATWFESPTYYRLRSLLHVRNKNRTSPYYLQIIRAYNIPVQFFSSRAYTKKNASKVLKNINPR